MKIYAITLYLLIAGISISCGSETQTRETIAKDIPAQEFWEKMNTFDNVQLLDVRRPEEWAAGIIPDASMANWFDDDFMQQINKLDKDIPVLIYCASGGRSGQAMDKMSAAGFREIYNLEGGIGAWRAAGLETTK